MCLLHKHHLRLRECQAILCQLSCKLQLGAWVTRCHHMYPRSCRLGAWVTQCHMHMYPFSCNQCHKLLVLHNINRKWLLNLSFCNHNLVTCKRPFHLILSQISINYKVTLVKIPHPIMHNLTYIPTTLGAVIFKVALIKFNKFWTCNTSKHPLLHNKMLWCTRNHLNINNNPLPSNKSLFIKIRQVIRIYHNNQVIFIRTKCHIKYHNINPLLHLQTLFSQHWMGRNEARSQNFTRE